MLHAVIMAGGSGTRFWPASRMGLPKQLLKLVGERTMIQATVDRLGTLVPPERTLVVTSARLIDAVAEQLPQLPRMSIVGEPCKRDTAACIGLAALMVSCHDPHAVMVVMPSDHAIATDQDFQAAIGAAVELVEAAPQRIVTFGILPTYPSESFGYIERGEPLGGGAYSVRKFREKPQADVAREYVAAGNFYWNAGIFVWRASTILSALDEYQPAMLARLKTIVAASDSPDFAQVFAREFAAIQGVSIDYAVMEHARDVAVIEATFSWDDVGSWQSIARLQGADPHGNTIEGRHLGVSTTGTIVRTTDEHLVVTLGVSDLIVVHTPDATLVARKDDEESIRQIVRLMEQRGWQKWM